MKKNFFLVCAILCAYSGFATCVTAKMVSANYTKNEVKFVLNWTCSAASVWVFVDYRTATPAGGKTDWTRATVALPSPNPNNNVVVPSSAGAWVTGGGTSAPQTVTLRITNPPPTGMYDWCAFASDYPPNVTLDKGTYTFKGTPQFVTSHQSVPGKTIARNDLTVDVATTFTDATGCPGIGNFYCPYTGDDLYMDLTHLCQRRATVENNREAYIKDPRDQKVYRIVQMPDNVKGNRWWMAENLKFKGYPGGAGSLTPGSSSVPNFSSGNAGSAGIGRYYCYNDNPVACDTYGALYTWETAMMVDGCYPSEHPTGRPTSACTLGTTSTANWTEYSGRYCTGTAGGDANCNFSWAKGDRGICPRGWHIPTNYEYAVFFGSVGDPVGASPWLNSALSADRVILGTDNTNGAGARLKSSGTAASGGTVDNPVWLSSPGKQGVDAYGFTALAAGKLVIGAYYYLGTEAQVWMSSCRDASNGTCWILRYTSFAIDYYPATRRSSAMPVRCVRD